jgi:hypothetical protein
VSETGAMPNVGRLEFDQLALLDALDQNAHAQVYIQHEPTRA